MLCRNSNTLEMYCSNIYHNDTSVFSDFRALPRPTHNVALFRAGHGILKEGDNIFEVHPGDILFVPKYARYTSKWIAEPEWRFHTIHFDYTWDSDPLGNRIIPVQKLPRSITEDINEDYAFLHAHQNDTGVDAFAAISRFFGLCYKLFAQFSSEELRDPGGVHPALAYLTHHYAEPLHVRELAQLCCMSESRFYTCFKEETGVSPIQYKNTLCIQRAMYMLISEPTRSMDSIAAACGFASAVYFRRVFKAIIGSTPTQYRHAQMQL